MMQIKKSTLQKIYIIFAAIVLVGVFLIMFSSNGESTPTAPAQIDSEIVGDVQTVRVTAKNGYSPTVINAKAGLETKLVVKTNGTFDCSSAITIPKLKISEFLPPTGEKTFDLGKQKAGTTLTGTCTMGMYSFRIKFS